MSATSQISSTLTVATKPPTGDATMPPHRFAREQRRHGEGCVIVVGRGGRRRRIAGGERKNGRMTETREEKRDTTPGGDEGRRRRFVLGWGYLYVKRWGGYLYVSVNGMDARSRARPFPYLKRSWIFYVKKWKVLADSCAMLERRSERGLRFSQLAPYLRCHCREDLLQH